MPSGHARECPQRACPKGIPAEKAQRTDRELGRTEQEGQGRRPCRREQGKSREGGTKPPEVALWSCLQNVPEGRGNRIDRIMSGPSWTVGTRLRIPNVGTRLTADSTKLQFAKLVNLERKYVSNVLIG